MSKQSLCICLLSLTLLIPSQAQTGKIWAVSIGIANYQNPMMTALRAPVRQAYEFTRIIERNQFADEHVPTLIDYDATRRQILNTLKATFTDPAKVSPDDLVIFYYSGHGIVLGKQIGLCPYDYYDQQQLITDQEIIRIMESSPAKHKVCIIEACKSEALTMAPLSQVDKRRFHSQRRNISGGLVYITSTEVGKPSIEFPDIGGVFSHYFLQAIEGEADINNDYSITSTELFDYLKSNVSRRTQGAQVPQINVTGYRLKVPIIALRNPDAVAVTKEPAVISPRTPENPNDFVLIEGGEFQMGDLFGDGSTDEQPVHSVSLSNYLLATHELTFNEYDLFCEDTGREKPDDRGWGRGRHPVIYVSWYDAIEYCNWRSQKEGLHPFYTINKSHQDPNNSSKYDDLKWFITTNEKANGYRLPTEAEWEYAARQRGQKVRFGNGQDIADPNQMNFNGSDYAKKSYSKVGAYQAKTEEVGSFSPNTLDLYDMSGNLWEWCWDRYASDYNEQGNNRNSHGATIGSFRVVRGGSWSGNPANCRTANRYGFNPYLHYPNIGVRLARNDNP
ncbi:MAG: SUMF1/EgtB/PvdO family nonheme iron enzyme [Bacteroidota bacterium]